ncbi:unnamed protein product [Closterium sp. NIES-53]
MLGCTWPAATPVCCDSSTTGSMHTPGKPSSTFPGIHDLHDAFMQDAFMRVRPEADPYTRDTLRLSVHYLPTDLFGGFCEIGQRLGRLVTVHANCCFGLEEKMRVLQQVG